jgi:hypothetical protein
MAAGSMPNNSRMTKASRCIGGKASQQRPTRSTNCRWLQACSGSLQTSAPPVQAPAPSQAWQRAVSSKTRSPAGVSRPWRRSWSTSLWRNTPYIQAAQCAFDANEGPDSSAASIVSDTASSASAGLRTRDLAYPISGASRCEQSTAADEPTAGFRPHAYFMSALWKKGAREVLSGS